MHIADGIMHSWLRRAAVLVLACAGFAAVTTTAAAQGSGQSYPVKPVRIVVGYPPGGVVDILGRVIAEKLTERLGQSVIVENRPGASGIIGNGYVAKEAPDGYTLLMGYSSNLAVHPYLYRNLPYDSIKDFAPIGLIANTSLILVVSPELKVDNLKELIEYAKNNPDALNYGATGVGSGAHLSAELLKQMAGINMQQISYKGSSPALTDLQGNHIQVLFDALPSALPLAQAGKLQALAVTDSKRSPLAPDVPTVAESGFPGYQFSGWLGLLAPAGTPTSIVDRLNKALNEVIAMPDVQERLTKLGYQLTPDTPQHFADFIKNENLRWEKFIKDVGIKGDDAPK